jgi:hypothetical protein
VAAQGSASSAPAPGSNTDATGPSRPKTPPAKKPDVAPAASPASPEPTGLYGFLSRQNTKILRFFERMSVEPLSPEGKASERAFLERLRAKDPSEEAAWRAGRRRDVLQARTLAAFFGLTLILGGFALIAYR